MGFDGAVASSGHKVLISTPGCLVGEYKAGKLDLALAYPTPDAMGDHLSASSMSRTFVMVVFRWEDLKTPADHILDLSPEGVGNCVSSVLSVLYGKQFNCHGETEGRGFYRVPDLTTYGKPCRRGLPFNSSDERTSFPVELSLGMAAAVEPWLFPAVEDEPARQIQTACSFYARALRNAEEDPEVAYLHLITAGEVLAGMDEYETEDLLDKKARCDLAAIRNMVGKECASEASPQTDEACVVLLRRLRRTPVAARSAAVKPRL